MKTKSDTPSIPQSCSVTSQTSIAIKNSAKEIAQSNQEESTEFIDFEHDMQKLKQALTLADEIHASLKKSLEEL